MNTYLHKGSLCLLEGYIQFEQWTAKDGSTRSRHSLRVDEMKMLDSKNSDSTPPGHQYQTIRESSSPRENQSTYTRKPSMDATIPEIDIDNDEILF
jgi:single-strand DNA-binding protein